MEFDFGTAQVRPRYDRQLKKAADFINSAQNPVVRIEGHTDSIGKPGPNRALSLKRANSVKSRLVSMGVEPGKIKTVGFGFRKPFRENTTELGRQKNRRAVTIITVVEP